MLRPVDAGTPGYRVHLSPLVDYSALLRRQTDTLANVRQETSAIRATYEREKAEIRANPPVAPYEVRKASYKLTEATRKAERERELMEKKKEMQRAKAAADAAIAEKERSKLPPHLVMLDWHEALTSLPALQSATRSMRRSKRNMPRKQVGRYTISIPVRS